MIKQLIVMLLTTAGVVYAQPVSQNINMLLPPPPPTLRDPMFSTIPHPRTAIIPGAPTGQGIMENSGSLQVSPAWIIRRTEGGVWQVHHKGKWLGRGQRIDGERIERISEEKMTLRSADGSRKVIFIKNYMRMHKEQE